MISKTLKLKSKTQSQKLTERLTIQTILAFAGLSLSASASSEMDNFCHKALSEAETNFVLAFFQSPGILEARSQCLLKEEQLKKLKSLDAQYLNNETDKNFRKKISAITPIATNIDTAGRSSSETLKFASKANSFSILNESTKSEAMTTLPGYKVIAIEPRNTPAK